MIRVLISACLLTLLLPWAKAQDYSSPESVVFDAAHERFLVSNIGSGEIIAESQHNADEREVFATGLDVPLGLHIIGDRLYVADSATVRGFDLETGKEVKRWHLWGCTQLNGLSSDGKKRLFVSDREQGLIFAIHLKNGRLDTLSKEIAKPNGLFYELKSRRLHTCTAEKKGSLVSFKVKNNGKTDFFVYRETPYAHLDGLIRANDGSWIFSSWGEDWMDNVVVQFREGEAKPYQVIWQGEGGAADIHYVPEWNIVLMPLLRANKIEMLFLDEVLHLD